MIRSKKQRPNVPSGGFEVTLHAGVVGEDGGGGTDFCAHVADGAHSGATDAVYTRSMVLHNGSRATLDRQDAGHLVINTPKLCHQK